MRNDLDHLPANKQRELERVKAIIFEKFEDAFCDTVLPVLQMTWDLQKSLLRGSWAMPTERLRAGTSTALMQILGRQQPRWLDLFRVYWTEKSTDEPCIRLTGLHEKWPSPDF